MLSRIRQLVRAPGLWASLVGSAAVCVATLTCAGGCSRSKAQSESSHVDAQPLSVAVEHPRTETIRRGIVQPGHIESYEHTPIYSKVPGFVQLPQEDASKVAGPVMSKVDIGYKMKKDQLMCKIWAPEIEEDVVVKKNRVDQAGADLDEAKAAFKVAKANVVTWQANVKVAESAVVRAKEEKSRWDNEVIVDARLVTKGVLDKQTLDEANNQLAAADAVEKQAEASLKAANASLLESIANRDKAAAKVDVKSSFLDVSKSAYEEAVAWFDYTKITAPYDGIVTRRYVHNGCFVQPTNSGTTSTHSEPLFMYMRTDKMRVVVQVPEYDAPLVKEGAKAIVKIQSLLDKEIEGKVTRDSWMLNNQARTLRVEIWLDNPNDVLEAGMYANVTIMADLPNVLTLPVDAVQIDGDQNFVYIVENGKAKRVNVRVGVEDDRIVQLISKEAPPKQPGDEPEWVKFTGKEQVVISNFGAVTDGQAVTISNK